jgi:hypothetical protein
MRTDEKRKSQRIGTLNLISYACLDQDNHIFKQGMGRTLNVSEGGILMETHVRMDSEGEVLLSIAMEEELMDFRGKVSYCSARADGKFESGIEFKELDEIRTGFLKQFILLFKGQQRQW